MKNGIFCATSATDIRNLESRVVVKDAVLAQQLGRIYTFERE
jgi:hypothetical protein